jgi:hypothetical protein
MKYKSAEYYIYIKIIDRQMIFNLIGLLNEDISMLRKQSTKYVF